MTVTIPRLRGSRSRPDGGSSKAAATTQAGRVRSRRRVNTAWTVPVMVLALCAVATGWVFARGAAAEAWLVAVVAVALGGVPVMLILLWLFGYEDGD